MKKKNIYIFDEYISSQKNGIGTYQRELLYCLNSSGYNVCLIIFNGDTDEFNIIEEDNMKKIVYPPSKVYFLSYVQVFDVFLRLYINDDQENIFFVNHSPCSDLLISLKTHFPLSKVIFTIHDSGWTMPLMGDLKTYRKVIHGSERGQVQSDMDHIIDIHNEEKTMYEASDAVVCLSADTYGILQDVHRVDKNRLYYIPNGIRDSARSGLMRRDRERRKTQLHLHAGDRILLLIGRPTRQKGVFDLVVAMDRVLKSFPCTKLVIIGAGNEATMKEIINATSKNAASFIFTGQLTRSEVQRWLSVVDIGIISSYYEQCSYTGIEMMMYGLPIVASDGLGVRNMFQDSANARIARIGNRKRKKEYPNNLANAILELLGSPDTCDSLSNGARQAYEEKYHIRYMKQKYNELIQSL